PPMWRLPIQICGTVRRPPLFCVISVRRAGSRSTRILSIATPFSTRRRSAAWQNGHAAVQYMRTFISRPSFLHRKPGLLPRREAAGKVRDAREAMLLQRRERLGGALAAVAIHDHRALFLLCKLRAQRIELGERHVLRTEHVARSEFVGLAHVDDERVLAIDE